VHVRDGAVDVFAHLKRVARMGTRQPIGKQRFLGIEGASVYSRMRGIKSLQK
jgi:hypothetical protein